MAIAHNFGPNAKTESQVDHMYLDYGLADIRVSLVVESVMVYHVPSRPDSAALDSNLDKDLKTLSHPKPGNWILPPDPRTWYVSPESVKVHQPWTRQREPSRLGLDGYGTRSSYLSAATAVAATGAVARKSLYCYCCCVEAMCTCTCIYAYTYLIDVQVCMYTYVCISVSPTKTVTATSARGDD